MGGDELKDEDKFNILGIYPTSYSCTVFQNYQNIFLNIWIFAPYLRNFFKQFKKI